MAFSARQALHPRHRHQEVAPGVADQPLDLALVVALARPAEAVGEEEVRLQLGEGAGALRVPSPRMRATASRVLS
jgi:hypothetical protein